MQSSGIAVEKSKFYLVNLNADPSMNELLVYYLKVRSVFREFSMLKFTFLDLDEVRFIVQRNCYERLKVQQW